MGAEPAANVNRREQLGAEDVIATTILPAQPVRKYSAMAVTAPLFT